MYPYNVINYILVTILAIIIQHVNGEERTVLVSNPFNDEDYFIGHNNNINTSLFGCVYGNCSCSSHDQALAHTSLVHNILIKFTTVVTLP